MENNNKTAVVFGITGGIGGAVGRLLLKEGWQVFGVGRNPEKLKNFETENPGIIPLCSELKSEEETLVLWREILKNTDQVDLVVMAAGNISVDSKFPGDTKEEREANSITGLINDNFLTKIRIDESFRKLFEPKETILNVISSHAAYFVPTDPRRENEEGYVVSMDLVSRWAKGLIKNGIYKSVILEEPALINTKKVFESLNKQTIGVDLNPDDGKDEDSYAREIYEKILN
jgi:NAD(P)-dependent dehydrogenase (short-subunit alcohol dehydrogenase family)